MRGGKAQARNGRPPVGRCYGTGGRSSEGPVPDGVAMRTVGRLAPAALVLCEGGTVTSLERGEYTPAH